MAQVLVGQPRKRTAFKSEWQLSTVDIAVAVLLGVTQAVVLQASGSDYVSRILQTIGAGGVIGAFVIVSLTGVLVMTAGYLRRRVLVMVLAAIVVALIRWFTGDPDGPLLMIYWPVAALLSGIVLWALGWPESWLVYGILGMLSAGYVIGLWGPIAGVQAMGMSDYLVGLVTVMVAGFFTCGVLAYSLGKALRRAGVTVADRSQA